MASNELIYANSCQEIEHWLKEGYWPFLEHEKDGQEAAPCDYCRSDSSSFLVNI